MRAWEDLPDRCTSAAAALQIELSRRRPLRARPRPVGGDGPRARSRRRATAGDRGLAAAAAAALALGEAAAGQIGAAHEHRAEALALVERLSDAELAPRLESLFYLGWAENYLEHYDAALSHADRGIAIARATGEGRLLVPMMLDQGLPVRDARARAPTRSSCARRPSRRARLSASPHELAGR